MENRLLQLTAPIALQAAKSKPEKPRKLNVTAYTGGVMSVESWGNVVIDLHALTLPKTVSVLDDHRGDLNSVLGVGRPSVVNGRLLVEVTLADTVAAQNAISLLEGGVALQSSIGVKPTQTSNLRPGAVLTVNGRKLEFTEATTLIEAADLFEISVLALGADSQTEVRLAAKRAAEEKQNPMEPTNDTITTDQLTAERERCVGIDLALREYPEVRARFLQEGRTVAEADAEGLRLLRASRPTAPAIHVNGGGLPNETSARSVIASAILLRAGRSDVALKHFGDRAVNSANELRCSSLYEIVRASLRLANNDAWNSVDRDQVIRAGLSTSSFPVGLSDAINKMALTQYQQAPGSWRLFGKVAPLNDFHSHPFIRPHFGGSAMPKLPPGGEIKHSNATEEVFSCSCDTFAEMLSVDRRDIINDSAVGLFTQFADALARKAASTVSDIVWTAILGNAGSFFGSGNTNLITGGTSALSIDALTLAITKMRKQSDVDGKPIDIQPRTLVVSPELEGLGRQIIRSTEVLGGTEGGDSFGVGTGSPVPDDLQLGVEPRISSTAFTGSSTTAWYLFASPMDSPVVVGFLGGVESPTIETVDSGPNVLGMTMRGYIDAGVALGDYRAAVKSNGV